MTDISKIKLPNGNEVDIKDSVARTALATKITEPGGGTEGQVLKKTVTGTEWGDAGGSSTDVELTQAEYDALPDTKLTDDINYFITDGNPVTPGVISADGVVFNDQYNTTLTQFKEQVAQSFLETSDSISYLRTRVTKTESDIAATTKIIGNIKYVYGYVAVTASTTLLARLQEFIASLDTSDGRTVIFDVILHKAGYSHVHGYIYSAKDYGAGILMGFYEISAWTRNDGTDTVTRIV